MIKSGNMGPRTYVEKEKEEEVHGPKIIGKMIVGAEYNPNETLERLGSTGAEYNKNPMAAAQNKERDAKRDGILARHDGGKEGIIMNTKYATERIAESNPSPAPVTKDVTESNPSPAPVKKWLAESNPSPAPLKTRPKKIVANSE